MEGLYYYWERLKSLQLYSQERRSDRYRIIFLWKVGQGLVQGYKVPFVTSPRRGRVVQVSNSAPASVRKAREASVLVRALQFHAKVPQRYHYWNS